MRVFVTGIGGLIGSAVAEHALKLGHVVSGVESDHRGKWFGPQGSTLPAVGLLEKAGAYIYRGDFRSPAAFDMAYKANVVVHCAAQTSHDFSQYHVKEDAEINFIGTLDLLEALKINNPSCKFVFMSTNKVYGDAVNFLPFRDCSSRYDLETMGDYVWPFGVNPQYGINENFGIDHTLHTPFGVSKLSADITVQEYATSYGMQTVCLRCGCMTGTGGAPVELQGFLGYLVKCAFSDTPYTIYGYSGKQVRDNISAVDVASAIFEWVNKPISGVFNIGGGRKFAVSVNEVISYLRTMGAKFDIKSGPARVGDHKWWITDTRKFESYYPNWKRSHTAEVINEMVSREQNCRNAAKRHSLISAGAISETRV